MSKKLARFIKKANRDLYASLPKEIRVLHALVRIANHCERRPKKAYSESQITRLVEQQLRREGVERDLEQDGYDLPDIDWGKLFMKTINTITRKFGLSQTQREDYLTDVISDMIMGQSIMKIRDRGPWKRNLVEQIEAWVRDGYTENRMKGSLVDWIKNKVQNIHDRYMRQVGDEDTGFQRGAPSEDYEGRDMFEELFTLDGLSSGQLSGYFSLMRSNPAVKQVVEQIIDKLERRTDDLGLVFRAYIEAPDASLMDLLEVEVRDEDGREKPLYLALDFEDVSRNSKNKLHNRVKKLRKMLKRMWPDLDDILRDMERG